MEKDSMLEENIYNLEYDSYISQLSNNFSFLCTTGAKCVIL